MKKNGFLEGAFIATFMIFFTKFLGIIYAIPFHHIVGENGGFLYGNAYTIYNLFLIISCAGIPLAISKLTSEYNVFNKTKEKEYTFYSARKIILIFSIISFFICFIFADILASFFHVNEGYTVSDIAFVIRCVSFAILVTPVLGVYRGYLQGHSYIAPSSFSQIIEQIIRIAVILIGSYVCVYIFDLDIKYAVGISVFGACAGGIFADIYLKSKTKKIKIKNGEENINLSKIEKKEIISKIILYSIPFIIINIANSLYTLIDNILLIKGLKFINNFSASEIQSISSVFTTWGTKLNAIVTSIATGFVISLVPKISENKAKKDIDSINDKINKILLVFLYIALPLSIFMSVFSREIWIIFYGNSKFGPIIFKLFIITAAIDALYIMINNALQGLSKSKLIYTSVILGLTINLFLDIPLMFIFNKLGIYPFYGTIVATIIGYTISLIIPLYKFKSLYNINYKMIIHKLPKIFLVYAFMIFLSLIYRGIIKDINGRITLILVIGIFAVILLLIYLFLNRKDFESILGKKLSNIFKRKNRD